jgi:cation/acetate symporter
MSRATSRGIPLKFWLGGGAILIAIVSLVFMAMQNTQQYFYSVNEVLDPASGAAAKNLRVTGAVLGDTINVDAETLEITFEIANVPVDDAEVQAAGGLAAAMSTADGLLLAIANALSHDLYYKIIDPNADTKKRLIVARVLLIFIGLAGAFIASLKLTGILGAVAWAFDFACSGLFFPLVLGVWWKRANTAGAIAGMIAGFGIGSWYLYMVFNGLMDPWFGLDHLRFGIVGMTCSVVAMVVVSLLTKAPSKEIQEMVDEVRLPSGGTVLAAGH